jgi:curved DNA-binding protein
MKLLIGVTKKIVIKPHGEEEKSVSVKVPRGVTSGTVIKLNGEGKHSKLSGEKGDMLLNIKVTEDERYELKGNDLYKDVTISYLDAILGADLSVESIDAKYKLKVSPGTQQGQEILIKDAGFINRSGLRGNLIARINIEIPQKITEKERELYTELKAIQSY